MGKGLQHDSHSTLVSIHKWHLLARYGVLRGFAPAACEKSVLNVALLRLRRKPLCGLASDKSLPFLNEHLVMLKRFG
jgi:hypothetical protein